MTSLDKSERRLIALASLYVQRMLGISEPDAYSKLQAIASHRNESMVEIAERVVTCAEVMHEFLHPLQATKNAGARADKA